MECSLRKSRRVTTAHKQMPPGQGRDLVLPPGVGAATTTTVIVITLTEHWHSFLSSSHPAWAIDATTSAVLQRGKLRHGRRRDLPWNVH